MTSRNDVAASGHGDRSGRSGPVWQVCPGLAGPARSGGSVLVWQVRPGLAGPAGATLAL